MRVNERPIKPLRKNVGNAYVSPSCSTGGTGSKMISVSISTPSSTPKPILNEVRTYSSFGPLCTRTIPAYQKPMISMIEKKRAGVLFNSDRCVTTARPTASNKPRSCRSLALVVLKLPCVRVETAFAHQCKPSSSSVILPAPRGRTALLPSNAIATNVRASTIGCVSMTQIAVGTTRSSIQSKDARACPNSPVLFVTDGSDEFMPLLLSSHIMDRQVIRFDGFAGFGISCQYEVDGSTSHTQVQRAFNSSFIQRAGRTNQQYCCAERKHSLFHIHHRAY